MPIRFIKFPVFRTAAVLLAALALFLPTGSGAAAIKQLRYAGATTLQLHFMPQAAKLYHNRTGIEFSITGGNTGPGIQALLNGTVDLAGAGRFLNRREKAAGLVEHLIGWDALYVLVHRDNPVDTLSRRQLAAILTGEIENWEAVGGFDLPIMVVSSPVGSGMRTSVKKLVLPQERFTDREVISPIVRDADRLVAQFPTSLTVLSASMVDLPGTKVLRIDNVRPTAENIAAGHYPLVKPLLLVTKAKPLAEVAEFVALARSAEGQRILAEKFFPLTVTDADRE